MRKVADASDGVWCRWCSLCFLYIYWMLLVWFACLARNSNVLGLILALLLSYIFSFLIVGIVVYQPKYSAPMHSIVGRWRFESLSIYQWLMVHHIHSQSLSLSVCFLPWPPRRLINGHSLCLRHHLFVLSRTIFFISCLGLILFSSRQGGRRWWWCW